jgi:hypothetical protein
VVCIIGPHVSLACLVLSADLLVSTSSPLSSIVDEDYDEARDSFPNNTTHPSFRRPNTNCSAERELYCAIRRLRLVYASGRTESSQPREYNGGATWKKNSCCSL